MRCCRSRSPRNGALVPVSSGGVGAPVTPPLLLGLAQHPTQNIIYAGLTGANQVGVFTFDAAGDLTLVGTVADQGGRSMLDAGQRERKIPLHGRYRHEQRRRLLAGRSPAPRSDPGIRAGRATEFDWRSRLPRAKPRILNSLSIPAATRSMSSTTRPMPPERSRRATLFTCCRLPRTARFRRARARRCSFRLTFRQEPIRRASR